MLRRNLPPHNKFLWQRWLLGYMSQIQAAHTCLENGHGYFLLPRLGPYNPTSMRERGSMKSRSASPMKLKDSTASMTARAGKSTR